MAREPIVAGQFYEDNKEKLEKQIKECFLSPFGPGSLPGKRGDNKILGVISPHAGYPFSGAGAAHGFKKIAEARFADIYIILGVNHTGMGRTSTTFEDWETPLGTVKVDKNFAQKLIEKDTIVEDRLAHMHEHSIEVLLPFLQFASKDALNRLRIVPIVVSSPMYVEKLGKAISEAIDETKKNVCLIASADFTHYGYSYGYIPFKKDVKENLHKLDHGAIDMIKKMDAGGFMSYVRNTGATICGYLTIATLIWALTGRAKKVELLKYYTSADVMGDYSTSVSYASLVFW